jgi:hypothetical protein
LKFLDQDDELIDGSLKSEVDGFINDEDVILSNWFVQEELETTSVNGSQLKHMLAPILNNDSINEFLKFGGVFTSAALYKTVFLQDHLKPVEGFVPQKADDWLIFAQVCLAGARYKTLQVDSYIWKKNENQLSSQLRSSLVQEHFEILSWIENELRRNGRLDDNRKKLLANYYAKQLLEAFNLNGSAFSGMTKKIKELHPAYVMQHGNVVYRSLCNFFGITLGVWFYIALKRKLVWLKVLTDKVFS